MLFPYSHRIKAAANPRLFCNHKQYGNILKLSVQYYNHITILFSRLYPIFFKTLYYSIFVHYTIYIVNNIVTVLFYIVQP